MSDSGSGRKYSSVDKMPRITSHILQKTSYLGAFIVSSDYFARAVTVYSCVRPASSPIELVVPLLMLLLALQYGSFLRGEITIRKMRWRWLMGALFFGTLFLLATHSLHQRVNWDVVVHAFSWPVLWDYVLEGIGEFGFYVFLYWMPFAGLLSLAAFIASFAPKDTNEGEERNWPGD